MKIYDYIFIIIAISCSNHKEKIQNNINSQDTDVFIKYLSNNFKYNINKDTDYFVIIPTSSCDGCAKNIIKEIESIKKIKNKLTILTTSEMASYIDLTNSTLNKKINFNTYIDKSNKIDRMEDFSANICLVLITKMKVIKRIQLDVSNYSSIKRLIANCR